MKRKILNPIQFILVVMLISLACGTSQPIPTSTSTSEPTATITATPTKTPRPSPTLRPTKTPNLAATEQAEAWNAEVQNYFDLGYLKTTEGKFMKFDDFSEDWAQLGWYQWWPKNISADDFYMSGHFKWSSAYRSADISGCGFVFAIQDNEAQDHYAVFLDRSRIDLIQAGYYTELVRPTRGTGLVNFGNPADKPVEADFTLIVKDTYAYVLVDGEVVGEYTLSQSKPTRGNVGLTLLSGTNKDYGTRCEITNLHLWIPKED